MAIVPYVPPVPLNEAHPEKTDEERRDPLAWLTRRFSGLFRKGKGTGDSFSRGKDSSNDPYGWMNDAFPCIFKGKSNLGSQKEGSFKINPTDSSKKSKATYDSKKDLFHDF